MDDVRECWVCLEATDPGGVAAAFTGCGCRGFAGHAHLSCLAAHAVRKADASARHAAWQQCPTCKQSYGGPMEMGLAQARWDLHRNSKPKANQERLEALGHLCMALSRSSDGGLTSMDDCARELPLREELLAVTRRAHGDGHVDTLQDMKNLAGLRARMGENAAALPLAEQALAGFRRAQGEGAFQTVSCMDLLSVIHSNLCQFAASRLMGEAAMRALRTAGTRIPAFASSVSIEAITNHGCRLCWRAGDYPTGLAVLEQAVTMARRVLGEAHPMTQSVTARWRKNEMAASMGPPGACALGTLIGLAGRPDLNGRKARVVGFVDGRYRMHLCLPGLPNDSATIYFPADKFVGIKPANLVLDDATARGPGAPPRKSREYTSAKVFDRKIRP